MSQRTQMRLHAITGSLSAIHTESLASVAAEPAAIGADHLLDILGEVAGSIKRIHGAPSFTEQAAGVFTHATASFSGQLDVAGMLDVNGAFDAAGAANLQSTLTVAGAVDINAAADIQGALNLQSSLTVAGASDLNGALDVQGAVGMQSTLAVSGAAEMLSTLDVSGVATFDSMITGSAGFKLAGDLDVNSSADFQGAVQFQSTINVDALATVSGSVVEDLTQGRVALVGTGGRLVDDAQITHSAGQLTVSGSTFSKDVSIVRDLTVGRDLSAVSGSFSGDLTVTGDLIINGTTTTINSTVVSVDDKALELGATATPTDTSANGGGIILKGATDKTILWQQASGAWEMNDDLLPSADNSYDLGSLAQRWQDLFLEGSADVNGNMDVAGTLTVGGIVDLNGALSASLIKIDGDVAQRLYIVDADGSMKDEANLTFNSSTLAVEGAVSGSGNFQAGGSLTIGLDSDLNGNLDVALASELHGAVHAHSTLEVDGVADFDADVYAAMGLYLSGAADFASTLAVADHVTLDKAADQSILKTGGDLHMSASEDIRLQAGGDVKLVDQYRAASTWSDAEGIKLAASAAEWSNFKATFGGEVSLLAALTGGGSGGKFKAEIASTSAFVTASAMADVAGGANFASKWASIVEPKIAKVDVFVNGQLMVSGSGMDYNVASNGDITFGFDLVADDIVMALVR